jgi:outer membrane immunogenic protein
MAMNWKQTAAMSLLAISMAPSAFAADMPVKARPVAVELYNWTGWYVGVNAGYGWRRNADVTFSNITGTLVSPTGVPGIVSPEVKGFLAGGQLGYNVQAGNILYGIEADADYASISGSTQAFGLIDVRRSALGNQRLGFFGTLRGRLGIVADRLLAYGTGGLAYGHTTSAAAFSNTDGCVFAGGGANQCPTGAASEWRFGWTAGAGLEFALTRNWSAKAEYLYYDLGRSSYTLSDPNFPGVTYGASANYRGNIVRGGFNFRFGDAVVAKY